MQKCSYCGRENDDSANSCSECGTSLAEPQTPIPLVTHHYMMREIQQSIWERFAVRRRQFYLAGFCVGAFGALVAAMKDAEHVFVLWAVPVGGALGLGAVWLLSFTERLQTRLQQAHAEGNPAAGQQVLFVVLGLIALVVVALLVAGVFAYFI